MKVNLAIELPDEVAQDLPQTEHELADILALGLREWKRRGTGEFGGLVAVLEKLAEQPPPEQIIALRPAPELQARVNDLLEKNYPGKIRTDLGTRDSEDSHNPLTLQ